jgi:phosphoribosylformimino-5-aminoimidazole carboxamide ribotide isomerase
MIIIPAIDLRGGRCVRLTQGQVTAETVYSENPAHVARRWVEAGAEMLHVVNLDGALNQKDTNNLKALEKILFEVNIPVQFGGGVRTRDDVRRLDDLGVTRIVIGTTAIENPVLLEHIIGEFGSPDLASSRFAAGRDNRRSTRSALPKEWPRWASTVSFTPISTVTECCRV